MRQSDKAARLAAGLLLLILTAASAAAPAAAEPVRAELGSLVFTLDASEWRINESGFPAFTCIAADCGGEPWVHVFERTDGRDCGTDAPAPGERRPLAFEPAPEAAGKIEITAWSEWSGCRAVDAPILNACVVHEGRTHLLTTALHAGGCNYVPALPVGSFLGLLGGIRTRESETP